MMAARTAQERPEGFMTAAEAAAEAGCTYRQVHYWMVTDVIKPTQWAVGSGNWSWWSPADVENLRRICQRLGWGMTLDAACRHTDPPLPPPVVICDSTPDVVVLDPVGNSV